MRAGMNQYHSLYYYQTSHLLHFLVVIHSWETQLEAQERLRAGGLANLCWPGSSVSGSKVAPLPTEAGTRLSPPRQWQNTVVSSLLHALQACSHVTTVFVLARVLLTTLCIRMKPRHEFSDEFQIRTRLRKCELTTLPRISP
jgi:hypothetical protein